MHRSLRRSIAVGAAAALIALPATAATRRPQASNLAPVGLGAPTKSLLEGKTIVSRVALGSSNKTIAVEGRGNIAVQDLAAAGLDKHHARNQQLRSVRGALLADPIETEEVVETSDGVTVRSSTTVTVVDPTAVGNGVSGFKRKPRNDTTWAANWRPADLDAFKRSLNSKPANHPLRQAAAQGDQALFTAIGQGKGDVTVTTELFFPSAGINVRNAKANVPTMVNGRFDYSKRKSFPMPLLPPTSGSGGSSGTRPSSGSSTGGSSGVRPGSGSSGSSGTGAAGSQGAMEFLTGFTEGDNFEWSENWDMGPLGNITVGAHAYWGVGLRVPVEITADMSPKNIVDDGNPPADGYDVTLSARAFDANADFYRRAGLKNDLIFDGKEFVLEIGAFATIEGEVLFAGPFKKQFGKEIDFGQQIQPPWGDCGTNCGVNVWIPSNLTHTGVDVLGIATGEAEIGFNVGGTGQVAVNYSSIDNNAAVASTYKGNSATVHEWKNNGIATPQPFHTDLSPGQVLRGKARPVGFKVSDPSYTWNIKITPGIRGLISIDVIGDIEIGPFWLHPFAFDLGSVTFPHHEGTKNAYERTPGTYTPPGSSLGVSLDVPLTAAGSANAVTTTTAQNGQKRKGSKGQTAPSVVAPQSVVAPPSVVAPAGGATARALAPTEVVAILPAETVAAVQAAKDWMPVAPTYETTGVAPAAMNQLRTAPLECRARPKPQCRNPKTGKAAGIGPSTDVVATSSGTVQTAWKLPVSKTVVILFGSPVA